MAHDQYNLDWFKKNIELQIEDVELELNGKNPVIYFDTSDIQDAVIGFRAFYEDDRFQKYLFDRKKALVNTLLSVGWLGRFSLLPPHLAEFHKKAENNFRLKPISDWESEFKRFLEDLGWADRATLKDITERTEAELQDIFASHAENGVLWFKAIYNMTPWHRKLGVWIRTGLFNIENSNLNYETIIQSPNFGILRAAFTHWRRAASINNIVDATALGFLIELVEKFNRGESDNIPRFFLPHEGNRTWNLVFNELKWDEKFTSAPMGGSVQPSTIFRDEDYFLYKIAFRPHLATSADQTPSPAKLKKLLEGQHSELLKWRKSVSDAINSVQAKDNGLYNQTLTDVPISDDLKEKITSLQEYSVLDQDWFKNKATTEFFHILQESRESRIIAREQKELNENREFKQYIGDLLTDAKGELRHDLHDFRLFSELFNALSGSIGILMDRIRPYPTIKNDEFFPTLGLIRYGFPVHIRDKVVAILNDLRSGDNESVKEGCVLAIRSFIEGRKDPFANADDLMVAAGVLLAVHNHKLLEDLFESIKSDAPHFSLAIANCEFILKRAANEKERSEGLRKLRKLEDEWKNIQLEPSDKTELSIGLAYLYYWAWLSKGGKPIWQLEQKNKRTRTDLGVEFYIDRAIDYADYAYSNVPSSQPEKKAYTLNQFVFCTIEGAELSRFRKLKERKDALYEYREKDDLKTWQFRFDDTIARYFFRKAFLPELKDRREELIDKAMKYADDAKKRSDGDREIDVFYDKVTGAWEDRIE